MYSLSAPVTLYFMIGAGLFSVLSPCLLLVLCSTGLSTVPVNRFNSSSSPRNIIKDADRGVTVLDGTGWYSKNNVKVLVVLAKKRQSLEIFRLVKRIDPNAFISQSSVIGVYGEGFDKLKVK